MIDSHCHLDIEPISNNLKDVIIRSQKEGVEKFLTICTTDTGYQNILKIINTNPIIYGTYGIHPHEADKFNLSKKHIIKQAKKNKKIIGIGETGLDFFYNNSDKKNQINSFHKHIQAALDLNLPIIVHSRSAEEETFEAINSYKDSNLKILMHCFTGSLSFAQKLFKFNAYFSASGIITFNNSKDLQETFKKIPLNKILIETDSPFLAPVPMRGKKNEPSFLKYTLQKLADLKNIKTNEADKITTDNFNNLFFG
jgi:TatD DNase family protein|tara:strand:- start:265 stop:1026 length:762 start_codon:yes stop_codon:yes gene_type:complete